MRELSQVARDIAGLLSKADGAVRVQRISWPAMDDELASRLARALRADLLSQLSGLQRARPDRHRAAVERTSERFRYFGDRLSALATALDEIREHETNLAQMPTREQIAQQEFATETELDLHRLEQIHVARARVRAQMQLEQIKATLAGRDPIRASQSLRARTHQLELERLRLIRRSGEMRRGLDLEIEAAQAAVAGDHTVAERLRAEAQRQYRQYVRLWKHGELARLRPAAERYVAGEPVDTSGLAPERAADLSRFARWATERVVFLAGSTHAGDEVAVARALLEAQASLRRATDRPLLFAVAPRKVDRVRDVRRGLERLFARARLLHSDGDSDVAPDAVVVDSVGLLTHLYSLAHGAFIGGGMGAVLDHNFCEPLPYGVATFLTPYRSVHPERLELIRSRAPDLIEEVRHDTLGSMARAFFEGVHSGRLERQRLDRARAFLEIARDVERDALDAFAELGEERIAWLERIRREGRPAWHACPHRKELCELGLLLPDEVVQGRVGGDVTCSGAARYLLDRYLTGVR